MRKLFLAVLLCSAFLIMGITASATPLPITDPGAYSGSGIAPALKIGNPSLSDLGFDDGYKIEPVTSGTFSIDGFHVTITTYDTQLGPVFDWTTSDGAIDAILVKGGDAANLFDYPSAYMGDTLLHAPVNPHNGLYFGLSHIDFGGSPVPEPATLLLLSGGLIGLAGFGRKKLKK